MFSKRVLILATLLTGAATLLALASWHRQDLLRWVLNAGWSGVLVFAGLYVLATLLLIPPGILNALSGALFGVMFGFAAVVPANIAAALIGFSVSRATGGPWAQAAIRRRRSWEAIDCAVAKAGFKIVFLLRCSPVSPFSILNYGLGLTRVRFGHYALASILGSLPGTLLYVVAGSTAASALDLLAHGVRRGGVTQGVLLCVGLIATVLVVALVTKHARAELHHVTGSHALVAPATSEP